MLAIIAMALVQAASFDADRYISEHQAELKAEIERGQKIKSLTNDQALIVYDQCLSREAAAMSRTPAREDQIFPLAQQRCLAIKAELLTGSPPDRFAQFKALDASKAATFPALTRQVRERRRAFEAQNGK